MGRLSLLKPTILKSTIKRYITSTQARKIASDGGSLLAGNGVASALGFITIAIVTRALGIDGLGILVLCQTIIGLIAALLLPKPWQALIRYGAYYKTRSEFGKLHALMLIGLLAEIGTSLLAYLLVRLGLSFWLTMETWDPLVGQGILIFSTTLLFEISGFPTTLYRLFRRYKLQATIVSINAIFMLILVVGAYYFRAGIVDFILIYTIATICGSLFSLFGAFHVMRSEGLLAAPRAKMGELSDSSGIVAFSISMHFTDLVGTIMRQVDYLVIAYFIGPAGVGIMKILKQFSRPFSLLANPIKQITYPEACELYSAKGSIAMVKYLSKASILLAIVLAIILLLLLLTMPLVLEIAFGPEYVYLSRLVSLYIMISVGFLLAQSLQVSALAMGKATTVFYSYVVMNLVYVLAILILAPRLKIAGVVWAFAFGAVVWAVWLIEVNRRELKREGTKIDTGHHIPQTTSH